MKNAPIFKIAFYIVIIITINSFLYLTAFSQTNLNNFFAGDFSTNSILARGFAQERQFVSVNLLPRYSAIFPPFVNSLMRNIDTFAGLAKMNLNDIKISDNVSAKDILNNVDIKGNFWYIPDISYTFLFNRVVGIEAGMGVHSVSYSVNISKDKMTGILDGLLGNVSDLPFDIPDLVKGFNGDSIYFKASLYYIPIHVGVKIITGRTQKLVNTFRLGLETVVYNMDVENIFSGEKSARHSAEATVYLSYELGWQIDLFPNKNWRVKPYIDFSLFEIGFYIRGAAKGIYEDISSSVYRLTDASSLGESASYIPDSFNGITLPEWSSFSKAVGFVTSLKIAIFPRFGFTIRF